MAYVVGLQLAVGQVPHLEEKDREAMSHSKSKAKWVVPSSNFVIADKSDNT